MFSEVMQLLFISFDLVNSGALNIDTDIDVINDVICSSTEERELIDALFFLLIEGK